MTGRTLTFREAFNEAIRLEMRRDPLVIMIGEDMAGGAAATAAGRLLTPRRCPGILLQLPSQALDIHRHGGRVPVGAPPYRGIDRLGGEGPARIGGQEGQGWEHGIGEPAAPEDDRAERLDHLAVPGHAAKQVQRRKRDVQEETERLAHAALPQFLPERNQVVVVHPDGVVLRLHDGRHTVPRQTVLRSV